MSRLVWVLLFLLAPGLAVGQAPRRVDFEKDVRPILVDRCVECHGPAKSKADLRLDRKASAFKGGESGKAIVPGKSGESPLIQRVASADKSERMPPKEKPPLTAAQVATLRAWIDQGAVWPDYPAIDTEKPHWAYQPLVRPAIPRGTSGGNPIDAFIQAKLREKGLSPSPAADKRTWLRRVTYDLTGLPPTPEALHEFQNDASPLAYERVVDRLLASPHYGERWARHWIDVAHFAESHGHDQDRPRPNAWPYRDYLIRSFNADKPYARFVSEQVAGDVLYPHDPWATAALGFLAAGPWDESSLRDINPDTIDNKVAQVLDRDDMLTTAMTTFVSATVNCARCHAHKFDPISQQDYYALQAVFAGVDRAEKPYDPDPAVHVRRKELTAREESLQKLSPAGFVPDEAAAKLVGSWEAQARRRGGQWRVLTPSSFATLGSKAETRPDGSLLFTGTAPETEVYSINVQLDRGGITAIRLEVLTDPSLPKTGPGRQDNGNLHLSEFRVLVWPGQGVPPIPMAIRRAVADFNQDGWTIHQALDGFTRSAWGIYPAVGQPHSAVFEFAKPLTLGPGMRLTVQLHQLHGGRHLIGRPRLSATTAADPTDLRPIPDNIVRILDVPSEKRSANQRAELALHVLREQVAAELAALPTPQLVYAATRDFKPDGNFKPMAKTRTVHVLRRGDLQSPMEPAEPGTLGCVPGLESRFRLANAEDEAQRRAALARWLTDTRNVLTWRSIVNRVWHYHFGRGIVDTPNDFGRMGSTPTHPELLDWLAVEFRQSGGSLKKLHRLIVLSAAYRQVSTHDEGPARIDGDNRYLWRMNRTRLDAESIRDSALQISGRLDSRMGGPSVKQFIQSPGIHVTPIVDYQNFDVDDPAHRRRSIYRFIFRTLPDPFLEAMDHPDASQWTPVRATSVTALQALALLNNKLIVRLSEHTATRLAAESVDPRGQVRMLYQRALLREPTAAELGLVADYAARHGLANACRMILNSNEFVFVP